VFAQIYEFGKLHGRSRGWYPSLNRVCLMAAPPCSHLRGLGLFMPPSLSRDLMAQTPTISSVASSDISSDDLPAASNANSQASEDEDGEPYDDPNLVVRDIVNIRVRLEPQDQVIY
jgi:hypothetical protein